MPADTTPGDFPTLLLSEPAAHVRLVTLNRPEAANAFNTQMARDLVALFEGLALEHGEIRCLVLTGSGEKAFCAGGDLKERNEMTDAAWQRQHLVYERMIRAVVDCPLPTVGAVNGAAYGGGCEIAAGLDFLYAAEGARFAQTEVRLGIIPGAGGTQTLARAVGERRAKELILTGRPFSAAEAKAWGLVNEVYPQDRLLDEAIATATQIAANAPVAVRQAKQAVHRGLQMSLRRRSRFRDRGLQPHHPHRGPPGGRTRLQREAGAGVPGAVRSATQSEDDRELRDFESGDIVSIMPMSRYQRSFSPEKIAEHDYYHLIRYRLFRQAADAVAAAWQAHPEVVAIALIGSVAKAPWKELPHSRLYRRKGIELWHECKDLDLALWLDDLSSLKRAAPQQGAGPARPRSRGLAAALPRIRSMSLSWSPGRTATWAAFASSTNAPKGKRNAGSRAAARQPSCGSTRSSNGIRRPSPPSAW